MEFVVAEKAAAQSNRSDGQDKELTPKEEAKEESKVNPLVQSQGPGRGSRANKYDRV
jgi:hypothetical protein